MDSAAELHEQLRARSVELSPVLHPCPMKGVEQLLRMGERFGDGAVQQDFTLAVEVQLGLGAADFIPGPTPLADGPAERSKQLGDLLLG